MNYLMSTNSDVVQGIDINNKVTHQLGNSKDLEVASQEPETKASQVPKTQQHPHLIFPSV